MTIDLAKLRAETLALIDGTTPGPWRVGVDDDGNPLSGRPGVFSSDELDCGIVHWDGFVQEYWRSARGDKEIHANARLIAAAPTLATDNLRLMDDNLRLLDEIEQLRGEIQIANDGWHYAEGCAELAMKHRDEAEAEIERLRTALKRIEGKDTYIDATINSGGTISRKTVRGELAQIACAALSKGDPA